MEPMSCERKWLTVEDCRVAFREWGGAGKAVVLLHGFPTNSLLWDRAGRRLAAEGYHVLAPEMLDLGNRSLRRPHNLAKPRASGYARSSESAASSLSLRA